MENATCDLDSCSNLALNRCSRCKIVVYCSQEHQKMHWKLHKLVCIDAAREMKTASNKNVDNGIDINKNTIDNTKKQSSEAEEGGKKVCRCMFCGEELLLESEESAVDHMRLCSALQEQLSSKDQFTIPTFLKDKISKK